MLHQRPYDLSGFNDFTIIPLNQINMIHGSSQLAYGTKKVTATERKHRTFGMLQIITKGLAAAHPSAKIHLRCRPNEIIGDVLKEINKS